MCTHRTILAGQHTAHGRRALAHYCPECNTLTWHAPGRRPLRQSRAAGDDERAAALSTWLRKPDRPARPTAP